jgi:AcrR family transcriptional regulator
VPYAAGVPASRAADAAAEDDWPTGLTPAHAAVVAENAGVSLVRRATPADAFRAARRRFLAGERLDMRALAVSLGISRKTLYRWTGDRERLLADVMSEIAMQTLALARQETSGRGSERIVGILAFYLDSASRAPFLRQFLENDPGLALRVLTGAGGVQGRMVPAVAQLIRDEEAAGAFASEVDPDTLAYAVVRLMEAFLYNDTMTRLEPDPDKAKAVLHLLLR